MGSIAYFQVVNGVSANTTDTFSPPVGYKWRLKLGLIQIVSYGVNSKTINLDLIPGYKIFGQSRGTLTFLTVTVAQATYTKNAYMAPYLGTNAPDAQNYPDFEISSADALSIDVTGMASGDVAYIYLLIEELLEDEK